MGIDLPRDIGTKRLPFARLARIIQHLPAGSATARARRGQAPDLDVLLLRQLEYWLHVIVWRETEDARKKRNIPTLVPMTGDTARLGSTRRDPRATERLLQDRQARRRAELEALEGGQRHVE
jgi:hypothetical protein